MDETGLRCIETDLKTTAKGYVLLHNNLYLHRRVWEYVNGPIPNGFDVHHRCENTKCMNIKHLELIEHKEHSKLHYQKNKKDNNIGYSKETLAYRIQL